MATTFASPNLPVPEVLEVGEALDSAYADIGALPRNEP